MACSETHPIGHFKRPGRQVSFGAGILGVGNTKTINSGHGETEAKCTPSEDGSTCEASISITWAGDEHESEIVYKFDCVTLNGRQNWQQDKRGTILATLAALQKKWLPGCKDGDVSWPTVSPYEANQRAKHMEEQTALATMPECNAKAEELVGNTQAITGKSAYEICATVDKQFCDNVSAEHNADVRVNCGWEEGKGCNAVEQCEPIQIGAIDRDFLQMTPWEHWATLDNGRKVRQRLQWTDFVAKAQTCDDIAINGFCTIDALESTGRPSNYMDEPTLIKNARRIEEGIRIGLDIDPTTLPATSPPDHFDIATTNCCNCGGGTYTKQTQTRIDELKAAFKELEEGHKSVHNNHAKLAKKARELSELDDLLVQRQIAHHNSIIARTWNVESIKDDMGGPK